MVLNLMLSLSVFITLTGVLSTFPRLWSCCRKPLTWGSSVDHTGARYRFCGMNLPDGWRFWHIYLRISTTRSRR